MTGRETLASLGMVAVVLAWAGTGWAEVTVRVSRERNAPATVEISAGEEVRWVNQAGGTAHIYTVHVSGTKVHAHTGSVVVK